MNLELEKDWIKEQTCSLYWRNWIFLKKKIRVREKREREILGILEETVRLGFLGVIERRLGEWEREHTCNFRIAESSPGRWYFVSYGRRGFRFPLGGAIFLVNCICSSLHFFFALISLFSTFLFLFFFFFVVFFFKERLSLLNYNFLSYIIKICFFCMLY